jgi:hypothetical protein
VELISAGTALLFREHPGAKPHLWFVLTDPDVPSPRVVAVMVRTSRAFTDATLILKPGDHPFIRHDSSVHYSTAQFLPVRKILKAIEGGRCSLQEDASPKLLKRLRKGLITSAYTIHAIRDFCETHFK